MDHVKETLERWNDAGRLAASYDRWAAFFCSMIGEPSKAKSLCELGLQVVRRELRPGETVRRRVEFILWEREPTETERRE